ncbi:MAG: nucleotidyl transferase AbiEii/AbiGii toxin family protein [bacterium]
MTHLETLLSKVAAVLAAQHQPWALVGGLAVSVRTEPRFTRDLDLAVAVPDDRAAEALIHQLHGSGFLVLATVEQDATRRLATARLAETSGQPEGLMLDLLFASSGIEPEICRDAERIQVFPSVSVPVARLHHLIALKTLARDDRTRPQDIADLRQLIMAAQPSDLQLAREAALLIEARGFNRCRNLVEAITSTWQEFLT